MVEILGFELGFDFGLNFTTIGSIFGIFLLLGFFMFMMRLKSTFGADYGSNKEKRLVDKIPGFSKLARLSRLFIGRTKKAYNLEKKIEKNVDKESKEEKIEGADKDAIKANKATDNAVEAARSEEKVEEATEALQGRGVGLIASVQWTVQIVKDYLRKDNPILQHEEQELLSIEELSKKIRNVGNYSTIDQRVLNYLKQVVDRINKTISSAVSEEKQKENFQGELIRGLKEATSEAKSVIINAKNALMQLGKGEKNTRRNFSKEFKNLGASLKETNKKLLELRKTKNVNPKVLGQLSQERNLLIKQMNFLRQLSNQLRKTYSTMDKEKKEMKKLLNSISRREKSISRYDNKAAKREKELEKRYTTLYNFSVELINSTQNLMGPHDVAIKYSGNLNSFYDQYARIVGLDLMFENEVRNVLQLSISMAIQMEAFQRMSSSLQQAEKAVDNGLAASTNLVSAIVGSPEQKTNLANLMKIIQNAGGEIDYKTRVSRYLEEISRRIEIESRQTTAYITALINKDNHLLGEIKKFKNENSTIFGSVLGTMVNRKVQIDSKYMSMSKRFERQMSERNKIASQSYKQVRGLESRSRAKINTVTPGVNLS
jgi:hypothetical protein